MAKISWLSYQQGRRLFILVMVTSLTVAVASVWQGDEDADLYVAGSVVATVFLGFIHFFTYYVSLGENNTLIIRNGRSSRILAARDFASIQPIRGWSFAVVLVTDKTFRFAANPFSHYTSNLFPEHEWAADLTRRIKLHLA